MEEEKKEKISKLKKIKKKKHFTWDENNLKENEEIQKEILENCPKIEEPKTPYHSNIQNDDTTLHEIDQLSPLDEDEHEVVHDPEFEKKRKSHYHHEFVSKKLLKKIEEEEEKNEENVEVIVKL